MSSTDHKAVFLSYASQDAEAAKRIADALRAAGVEVWFDAEGGLEHGDEWDAKIRRQIKECVLFIAVISANTQAREEGYFRIEWDLAAERARGIASGVAFILPIVIDDTREPDALVPDRFRKVQWTRLPGGTVPPDVKARFLKLWSHRTGVLNHQAERSPGAEPRPEPSARSRAGLYALAAAAVVAAAVGGWFLLKPRAGSAAAAGPVASSPGKLSEARQLDAQARALIDDDLMAVRENYRLADEFSRRAVTLDATDGEAWATAARVSALILQLKYEMTPERKELAKIQVERANRLAPASIETGFAQAIYLAVNGDVSQAEQMLRQLIQRAPADKRLWRHLGTILMEAERFDEVLGLFRQAGGLLDRDPRSETLRGSVLVRVGRYREAEAVLEQVLQQSPTQRAYSRQLTLLGFYRCDLPAASRFLDRIPPGLMQEDAMINLAAEIWLRLGDGDKALKVLQKSPRDFLEEGFEIRPKGYVAGHALQLAGRPTAALAEWRQALVVMEKRLAANPNQPLLLYWHALLQALTGQKAAAIETRKLYRELETKPDAWFDAILLVALGDNEQAIHGLLEGWPKANFNLRSDIRGDLMYAPWLAAIRSDPRIQALIAEHTAAIERDRTGPAAASVTPKVDDKSVAVLAFANLSSDKEQEYFSDGISEEVLNVLAKVPGLKVSARTSAFYFKGKQVPMAEIAQQLGVAYVVEGSVQRAGDRVKITAQLIKAADGFHVWSDSFTRDMRDIFAVQDEIAAKIATSLTDKLGMSLPVSAKTTPEAYTLYLQARATLAKRGVPNLREAVRMFDRVIALDPDYLPARSGLAISLSLIPAWSRSLALGESLDLINRAKSEARLVIERQPGNAEAWSALGYILSIYDWRWEDAAEAIARSLALAPNDAEILNFAGDFYRMTVANPQVVEAEKRAVELNPLQSVNHTDLSLCYITLGQYELAVEPGRRGISIAPELIENYEYLLRPLGLLRRFDEMRAVLAEARRVAPENSALFANMEILAALYEGRNTEALRLLDKFQPHVEQGGYSPAEYGWHYLRLGQPEKALPWLLRGAKGHDASLIDSAIVDLGRVAADPVARVVLEEPGLKELMELRARNLRAVQVRK